MTCITTDIRQYLHDLAQAAADTPIGELMLGTTDTAVVAAALRYCATTAAVV